MRICRFLIYDGLPAELPRAHMLASWNKSRLSNGGIPARFEAQPSFFLFPE